MIDAATLMAACDEVEVSCHPTEYKQAAAARKRAEKLVLKMIGEAERLETADRKAGREPAPGTFQQLADLRAIAEALKF